MDVFAPVCPWHSLNWSRSLGPLSHNDEFCDLQFHRPAASVIARRAGATQYAEMFDDGDARSRHGIHKRLVGSSEDVDYESYQGVLGRPGVDFPVLTGIPNTNFNCRDVGNGYFADLATDCQVSGICGDLYLVT